MKKRLPLGILILFSSGVLQLTAVAAPLVFPQYGFQIDPLDAKFSGVTTQALCMYLPPHGGLPASVNVLIEPYPGSFREYTAMSRQQFDSAGFKMIVETSTDSEWKLEYTGTVKGVALHWYARAIFAPQKVTVVTATALESEWKTVAPLLRPSVDSFKAK
jgi:hypothetical protein